MQSLRFTAVAVIALAALACHEPASPTASRDTGSPQAIQGGEPTGSAYANVGALMFDYDRNGKLNGDDEWCTGSLVAPDVFLTAAHCVVTPYTPAGSQFHVSFAPDLYAKGIRTIAATHYVYDPAYGHDQAKLHDLALIFLPAGSTRGMTPVKLPKAGALDEMAAKGMLSKVMFVNVGYGVSANRTGIPQFGFDGVRKMSKSEFMGLQPTWLGLLMNAAATGEGGDCYGDSGGPKFIDGDAGTIY
ncbi:MAG TPA: trypsin-like serine protease, partial [Gemmatimonadaceae bacterium]|nr:trypsin-like serine protease [Gemmatimonadaceae bacterium]